MRIARFASILLMLILPLRVGAAQVVRVQMPAAWIPHLQPVLDALSGPDWHWVGEATGEAEIVLSAPAAPDPARDVVLLSLAAVVPVESALLKIERDALPRLLAEGSSPHLPGWRVAVSREVRDLSGWPVAENVLMDHAGTLAAALRQPKTIAVVRWQTRGWPANLRPLQLDGAYSGALVWYAAVSAARPEAEALVPTLRAALRAWGALPIEIAAVGDVMLGRSLAQAVAYTGDPAFPTRQVAPLLASADITLGNLEMVLSERGTAAHKRYTFRAVPSAVAALTHAGFDVVSLANNHAMDFGVEALMETLITLQTAGIAHTGAGLNAFTARTPAILERNGLRVAFLGYVNVPDDTSSNFKTSETAATDSAPGVAWAEPQIIAADVAAAKTKADVVIVLLHSGYEGHPTPNAIQRANARAAIDAGAAAVIGAHPHVLQGVEYYKGGFIAYSLGNFVFDMTVKASAILRLWVGPEGVRASAWEPVVIGQVGQPLVASPAAAAQIRQNLYHLTYNLNR